MKAIQPKQSDLVRKTALALLIGSSLALTACSGGLTVKGGTDTGTIQPNPGDEGNGNGGNNGGGGNGGGNGGGGNGGGGDGGDNGGGDGGTDPGTNPGNDSGYKGVLAPTLQNTGEALDNVLPLDLANTAGQLGGSLDTVIEPLVNQVTTLTQGIGDATGLGKTVDGLVGQTGNLIVDLGQQLGQTALPLNVGTGVGGLVEGVGLALGSAGGLLNGTAENPVGNTLGHLTGGINDLTSSLLGPGSIGHDLTNNLGLDGLLNGERQAILEPALANTGTAVDNLLPLGLNNTLGDTGAVLDGVVSPVGAAVTVVTQNLGDSTGLGQPINALLGGLGSALAQAGGQLDHTAPIGLGGTVQHLGQAVSSAGGLLQPTTDNPNPLGLTLDHATQSVAALTAPLGGSDGLLGGLTGGLLGGDASNNGLLAPVTNLLAGVTGGLGGGEAMNAGLLAPVTNLLGGVAGGLGGGEAMNAGLLAPVTNLLGGVAGGLGGGEAMNAGLLAPVTNLLGGVTGGLGGGEASNPGLLAPVTNLLGGVTGSLGANAPSADSNSNQQGGLLSPVTGLLGGLVGKRP